MTDYVVFGTVQPERVAAIVAGVAEGCVHAGCALVGGETAEHPGHLGPDDFDLAGAATGVVEADRLLGPQRVRAGDAVLGLASSGLHSNGYSLVRQVLDQAGLALDAELPELGVPVGEELLDPTRHLRPGLPRPGGRVRRARASRTSPAAGWRPTWPGCCRRAPARCWTGPPGGRRRSSACWRGRGGIDARGDGAGVQHGGRHGGGRRPGDAARPPGRAGSAWRDRLGAGGGHRPRWRRPPGGRPTRLGHALTGAGPPRPAAGNRRAPFPDGRWFPDDRSRWRGSAGRDLAVVLVRLLAVGAGEIAVAVREVS